MHRSDHVLSKRGPAQPIASGLVARLRPEIALLLCCARLSVEEPAARERIVQWLAAELDWEFLIQLALRHGLCPLLYWHLNALAPTALPKVVFVALWGNYETNAHRNRRMASELVRLYELFDANELPTIPYKGPALAVSVYGNLALREFGDLDILVKPEDVLRARDLLEGEGYQSVAKIRPIDEQAFLRAARQYDFEMLHAEKGILVELHWKTNHEFAVESIQDDEWWRHLGRIQLGDTAVRSLAPHELLLILCLHGTKHYWGKLGWLVDVAELIRQNPSLDWAWILAKVKTLRCERRLAIGLYLAHELLAAPLPHEVWTNIVLRPQVTKLAETISETLFDAQYTELSIFERLRLDLKLYDRRWQQFRHCLVLILTPNMGDWSDRKLPRALSFLYLPLRLARLAKKYALTIVDKYR